MNTSFSRLRFLVAAALLFLAVQRPSLAGSATWTTNPTSGDWNTAANWSPQTVPNATTDVATFGPSNLTTISNESTDIHLDSVVFNSGAPPYTITFEISGYFFYGAGIVNNSGSMQSFIFPEEGDLVGGIFFNNSSSAGDMVSIATVSGNFFFNDASSGGSASFTLTDGDGQASMNFLSDATAGDATINASAGAVILFYDSSTGGNATLNLNTAAFVLFEGSNNAEHMTGNSIGGDQEFASQIDFEGFSSAGEGTFTTVGGSTSGEQGAFILFDNTATADNATFVINGGMGAGLTGTSLHFIDTTTAANANITANGGVDGSAGGVISFQKQSTGGTASITLNGNAALDISTHNAPGITIGSLSGKGSVLLGANTLTIGSNNQSTTFSGAIQGGGGMSKSGTGTLTLSGNNTYSGQTTVSAGVLLANTKRASSTGAGSVNVNAGTLGGNGMISGPVTIGTGSGSGASLAPSIASEKPLTLSLTNALALQTDGTYICQLSTKNAAADQVGADGITIQSGAQFVLRVAGNKKLQRGEVFTVITNSSASPISGAFANLGEGTIIAVGHNRLQASYVGGDGNDLTLTVVR